MTHGMTAVKRSKKSVYRNLRWCEKMSENRLPSICTSGCKHKMEQPKANLLLNSGSLLLTLPRCLKF